MANQATIGQRDEARPGLPTGTVTFLFTDIEGSTQLWERHPRAMAPALARHDALLRAVVETHGGHVFKTVGDAFYAAFPVPLAGFLAAVEAQRALAAESWGDDLGTLRVRMALHTGQADERGGDYFGPPLNRVARLLAAGHGGQVLLSRASQELVRDLLPPPFDLRDLGEHRLKSLHHTERVFQLVDPDLAADFPPLRSLDNQLHNLPTPPTPLIGREREVDAARTLLGAADGRLVTLTGSGGAGKTRLSMHVAAELAADFADGVFFVSLAPCTDPDLVLPSIATVVGVREAGGQPLRDLLREALRPRHLLLVLDNFEQVVAAAPAVADLLADCPKLRVLATSRTRLQIRGERDLPVPPLALPAPATGNRMPSVEHLVGYEAVRLFVDRAQAVKADFALTPQNAAAVVEICRRLDGLPLAIELAAARVRLLPPQKMLARLDRSLDLLAGGARDLPSRHQTMRGAIAWSYDLLAAAEQRLFSRLSIFAGGCSFEAAEAVADDGDGAFDLLDGLAPLVDHSLLRQEVDGDDEPRFVMLDTIREFGLERLAAGTEADAIGGRHAAFFLTLAEETEPHLEGPEQTRRLDCLDRDHANMRAALAWLRDHAEAECALRLAGALWRFWWLRGHFTEGRIQVDGLLRHAGEVSDAVRAKAQNGAGVLAESQGDYAVAAPLHEESLAISRALGDKYGIAWSLNNLGVVALNQGDYERARTLLEENLAIAQEVGDTPSVATAMTDLGQVAHYQGDHDRASSLMTQSLTLFRAIGNESRIARALINLGRLALEQGDYERAEVLLGESLPLSRQVGDKHGIVCTLNNLAEVARGRGDGERAAALYEESWALAVETGSRLYTAIALENLADLARHDGDDERASSRYRAALVLYQAVGDWTGIADCLISLAKTAVRSGQAEAAAKLLGAAVAMRQAHALGDLNPDDDHLLETTRTALGERLFEAAWQAGQAMPVEQMIGEATTVVG